MPEDTQASQDTQDTSTGVPEVDDVLVELDLIDQRPVAEHVAAFEGAHQRLRQVLDAG